MQTKSFGLNLDCKITLQGTFAKYDLKYAFYLVKREDFLASLEKQYLIKTPHSPLRGPPSPTGEG